jgi:hypothetical protein
MTYHSRQLHIQNVFLTFLRAPLAQVKYTQARALSIQTVYCAPGSSQQDRNGGEPASKQAGAGGTPAGTAQCCTCCKGSAKCSGRCLTDAARAVVRPWSSYTRPHGPPPTPTLAQ